MGTTCQSGTRAELIRELTTDEGHHKTIAHTLRGSNLWTVKEYERDGKTVRYICLFLLSSHQGMQCYKPIDETMGPCEVDCPLAYLELAPEVQPGYAVEWRNRVRAFHEAKRAATAGRRMLAIGQTVKLQPGCSPAEVVLVSVNPLRGRAANGLTYKLAPRFLDLGAAQS